MEEQKGITQITEAQRQLTEARDIYSILEIRDKAMAFAAYADAQGAADAANLAKEVQLRCERKAGEFLRDMPKNKGEAGQFTGGNMMLPAAPPTLDDIGISKMQSSRWQQIANVPDEEFEEFVESTKQENKELTQAGILRLAHKLDRQSRPEAPPLPEGKYQIIYADPPWEYDNSGFDQSAANIYPTMTVDEICKLPVNDLAGDSSVLFLWATSPLLPEALRVMYAWGFKYKASRVWTKNRAPGIGWWVRTYHEFLLIGAKGDNIHPKEVMHSIITGDVGRHSEKPKTVYVDIENNYSGPFIELFARNDREGWHSWGNEL